MKVTTEKLERSQMAVEVEVEPEQLEKSMERAYRRLANRADIPGFRRGKAPRFMVERYLGKAALLDEALDILVPEAYNQAVAEQSISTVGQPQIEILQVEPAVTFKATVALRPTVELGDYKQLSFTSESVEVTEEQINEVLEQLRSRYAPWEPAERPVQLEDMVTISIQSQVEDKPFINETDVPFVVTKESPVPVPGFAEQLVGMAKGDSREFTLTLPDDYPNQDYAGKSVSFTVSVSEIKEKRVAELDDDFAKGVGAGYESLAALREAVTKDLTTGAEREVQEKLDSQIIDAVVGLAQVEYPEILVDHEIEHIIQDDRSVPRDPQGRIDDYLRTIGQSPEEFKESYREEATRRVVRSLVLGKVAELEQIEIGLEEINAEIDRLVQDSGEQQAALRRLFDTPQTRDSLAQVLFRRQTIQRLIDLTTSKTESKVTTKKKAAVIKESVADGAVAAGATKGRGRRRVESKTE